MAELFNQTRNEQIAHTVVEAKTVWTRLVGLLAHRSWPEGQALWLEPCDSIHTYFMRFAIDVIIVDRNLQVLAVLENVGPWRLTWPVWKARSTFELQAGELKKHPVQVGDQLHVRP